MINGNRASTHPLTVEKFFSPNFCQLVVELHGNLFEKPSQQQRKPIKCHSFLAFAFPWENPHEVAVNKSKTCYPATSSNQMLKWAANIFRPTFALFLFVLFFFFAFFFAPGMGN